MIEYENLHKVNKPFYREFRKSFEDVLDSGMFILGRKVKEFENAFAGYHEMLYCTGVASGMDALTISMLSLDIPKGSEIIVPANAYIATVLSVMQAGHKPVLVEPNLTTYNIDPVKIEEAITESTKAVLIVHLYGKPCEMDTINAICKKHGLYLIEDCAQSHGAKYKERKTGTYGDISGFSFYPTKNLGCLGDGGAILTNNQSLFERAAMIRNYGSRQKYFNEIPGMNSRLDEIQAGFLLIKLNHLDEINLHKRQLAEIYFNELKNDFVLPVRNSDYYDVYHIFNIRHEKRDKLRDYLQKNGIGSEIHYPLPPNRQNALKFLWNKDFPISEEIHNTTLSLPISFFHSPDDIAKVAEILNKF